ncbi:ABC transporter permease [Symbioplanes lichenis]|uniref:ABC transporter permease n=1 Tax=Symbioplanes lichenis TaxID=1629072 RepID=UPI00273A247F|nr:FtsX-like permease family protein [Actinoplanes lichenis]
MTRLAARMLRHRPGSTVATLLALAIGALVLTAMGMLVESGVRYHGAPYRYAAADLVVAHRDLTVTGKDIDGEKVTTTVPLSEGGTVGDDLAGKLRDVPGVTAAVADRTLPVVAAAAAGIPLAGHGWGSASLMPYAMVAGGKPAADNEVVVDNRLAAAAGFRPGQTIELLVDGTAHRYEVSGVAEGAHSSGTRPAAVFFTDRAAAAIDPRPGRADAVGVFLAPGADRQAVTAIAAEAGARVYAGDDRGQAEESAEGPMRNLLIQIGGTFGGYVVLLVVFVVAGTVGLSVRHRRRDLALLRAVAATPRQVRGMVTAEAALLGLAGAVLGIPAGLLAARWVHGELVDRGFLSATFPMVPGLVSAAAVLLLTVLVAVAAALLAVRRISRIRPVEALGEIAVEPARGGKVRLWFGLLCLAGAVASSTVTVAMTGEAALAGALGMLYLFVAGIALLAPWVNEAAARLLSPLFRRVWGASGHLAAANLRANAKGGATVLTALVLAVGFGGSVWFLQDNIQRATVAQSRDGLIADRIVTSPAGLPSGTTAKLRELPGVEGVTGLRPTSAVVRIMGGEAESVGALALDPVDAARTLDLKVSEGDLAALDRTSLAVSSIRAGMQGWHAGDQIELWLGDGTPATLTVAAVYERGLGFGDLILHHDTVAGHTAGTADSEVLVKLAPGATPDLTAALTAGAANASGRGSDNDSGNGNGSSSASGAGQPTLVAVGDAAGRTGQLAEDLALSAWLNKLLVGVMVGYAALAAANTMVMAALARRRELALLRIVGVTGRQARRMVNAEQTGLLGVALLLGGAIAAVTLTAVVHALTGSLLPWVPPLGGAAILAGATLLALGTTILPVRHLLRVPPIEHLGLKE